MSMCDSENVWITNVLDQNSFVLGASCKDIVIVEVNATYAFNLLLKRSHDALCTDIPDLYFTALIS